MKIILFAVGLFLFVACNMGDKKDSVEAAEDSNEQRADTTPRIAEAAKEDQEFMVEAASGGLMEVQMGQLAAQYATNQSVKDFAQKMVTDHGKVNDELKALAAQKNISVPSTPGKEEQDDINELTDKKAKNFDKEYMDMMVDDHKEDVNKFEKAANDCKDPDIKAFAAKHLPHLKMHLDTAQAIRDRIRK